MLRYLVSHPTAANLLMVILLAMGLLSLSKIRRETFPDLMSVEVQIRAIYPGATAEDVEDAICQRIEDAVDGVRFVSEVRSEAREGVGIVTAEMVDGGDYAGFKDEIDTAISAITEFPAEVEDPTITQLNMTDAVMSLLVAGPMSAPDLKAYCEDLKDRLQQLDEVSLVEVDGFSDHQLRVELPDEALMRYGLSVADIADIVSRQNVDLPLGTIEARDGEILIRFLDQRTTPRELEELVIIGSREGAEIRLGDLGRVVDLFELDEERLSSNGNRAALLRIQKNKSQDTIRVAREVKGFVEAERVRQPQIDLSYTQDMSTLVSDRLRMLIKNGWQGMLLVFLSMWVFFNIRLSFWVIMSLPVSFLGAFFLLPHIGLTINMLTMVGLLLALGLLMDDGIVIAENIASHRARGKSGLQAAIDGTREVAGGVLSSFATTICVLGPLATLSGDIGKILRVVPMILILVMTISLIEAFCILPNHLSHSLGAPERPQPRLRQRVNGIVEWVRDTLLGGTIERLIAWRYLWIGLVIFLLLGSVSVLAGGVLRFQALPEIDGDTIVGRILLPPGTPLSRTEEVVEQVTTALDALNEEYRARSPEGKDLVQTVYTQYNLNSDAHEAGPHVATVSVDLLSAAERGARLDDILQSWRREVGVVRDAISLVFTEPGFGPAGRAIDIRFSGDDLVQLNEAALATAAYLRNFKGVYNLNTDLRRGKAELRLRMREGALGLGVDAAAIARQLRAAFQGVIATELQVGAEAYEVDVQLRPESQDSLADLDYFHFTLPDGKKIPLSSIVEIEEGAGWSRIARVDGQRTVSLLGDVDPNESNTMALLRQLQQEFLPDLLEAHPGLAVEFEGEISESGKTQSSMLRALGIGLLGVFVLLSFQFKSYIEPLIVMVSIPLALVGVVGGHLLMGLDLSMPSMLGFFSLAGVVVNNSILLVLFIKLQRQEGHSVREAAAQASQRRFRAILIASSTTIMGLLPIMLEPSLQAQVLVPLVVSVAFGLLASVILVLLVTPCLYVILDDFGLTVGGESHSK